MTRGRPVAGFEAHGVRHCYWRRGGVAAEGAALLCQRASQVVRRGMTHLQHGAERVTYLRDEQRVVTKMSEDVASQASDIELIVFQEQDPVVRNPARLNLIGN
jgi:hypothetical protein